MPGQVRSGTSGFAYKAWTPRFYPPGLRPDALLPYYAGCLDACELNNTYYTHPTAPRIAGWLAATPDSFRFTIKAQRGGSARALTTDPAGNLAWLTPPYRLFGERLGAILYCVPGLIVRDDARLSALLAAWPSDLPLVMEFQHESWHVDETFAALRDAGAVLCLTDLPESAAPPDIRRTGPFLYLRLRRHDYSPDELAAWAARIEPFVAVGDDAYVFFRHDEVGRGAELALAFAELAGPQ